MALPRGQPAPARCRGEFVRREWKRRRRAGATSISTFSAPVATHNNSPGTIQQRICQRHAATFLINAGQRHVGIRNIQNRIAGNQRSRVAVRAESQMHEIQHRRRAGNFLKCVRITFSGGFQIIFLHRHGVDLFRTQRRVRQQAFAQMREIAIRVTGRRDALIHLKHLDVRPRNFFVGQSRGAFATACARR